MRSPHRRERISQRPATYGAAPLHLARRGASAVEAALVMNVFLLFIFAIMEFGHFVMVKQLMDIAARDGARMAATGATRSRLPRSRPRSPPSW